jgi:hypothetical protein
MHSKEDYKWIFKSLITNKTRMNKELHTFSYDNHLLELAKQTSKNKLNEPEYNHYSARTLLLSLEDKNSNIKLIVHKDKEQWMVM